MVCCLIIVFMFISLLLFIIENTNVDCNNEKVSYSGGGVKKKYGVEGMSSERLF